MTYTRATVLVVDDHLGAAESAAGQLEAAGFRVHAVRSSRAALSAAEAVEPDVVVLEPLMNDGGGWEVAAWLRRRNGVGPALVALTCGPCEAAECDAAGFDRPVGERGSLLSGGQRSLLVMARAMVSPSKMLFLDEPTGAMDTQTEMYFIEKLKTGLAADQSLIVSTHRHNMLNICERLIVIDGGRIFADGPRDEVLNRLATAAKQESK